MTRESDGWDNEHDTPPDEAERSMSDPRLEIPEVLRRPIDHPSRQGQNTPSALSGFGELGKAMAIGFDFLFAAVAGGVIGWFIDRWAGTSPGGILIGILVGFGGGTYRLLKRLNATDKQRPTSGRGSPRS